MESERSQSLLFCVDAGRSMAARVDGLTKLDHAVNAALFLAFVAVRNGDRVGLAVFADGVKTYLAPAAGRGSTGRSWTRSTPPRRASPTWTTWRSSRS